MFEFCGLVDQRLNSCWAKLSGGQQLLAAKDGAFESHAAPKNSLSLSRLFLPLCPFWTLFSQNSNSSIWSRISTWQWCFSLLGLTHFLSVPEFPIPIFADKLELELELGKHCRKGWIFRKRFPLLPLVHVYWCRSDIYADAALLSQKRTMRLIVNENWPLHLSTLDSLSVNWLANTVWVFHVLEEHECSQ